MPLLRAPVVIALSTLEQFPVLSGEFRTLHELETALALCAVNRLVFDDLLVDEGVPISHAQRG